MVGKSLIYANNVLILAMVHVFVNKNAIINCVWNVFILHHIYVVWFCIV